MRKYRIRHYTGFGTPDAEPLSPHWASFEHFRWDKMRKYRIDIIAALGLAPPPTVGHRLSHCRSDKIALASDIIAALEFGNSAGCGASALSGLRFNASKNGELPGLSVRGWA